MKRKLFTRGFGAGAYWQASLKTRITLLTLCIFVTGLWSLSFYARRELQADMQSMLGEQQLTTVSFVGMDINRELDVRLKTLDRTAALITPVMLDNAASTQAFLQAHTAFTMLFNDGGFVMRRDGVAIAEVTQRGRLGINHSASDYFLEAVNGKTAIGKPVMGTTAQSPLLHMAAPIRDSQGEVIGVVVGTTDFGQPNFLDHMTKSRYGRSGGYLLVAPQHRLIVAATEQRRTMEVLPERGSNPAMDRRNDEGFEGTQVFTNPRGVEVLNSSKKIPVAGWYLVALLPTEEAFAPIRVMQQRMLLATVVLTLLAGAVTWWMVKRQLAPMQGAAQTLSDWSKADLPARALQITHADEIGTLIAAFNHLLTALGQRQETLRKSESRFRHFFEKNSSVMLLIEPATGTIIDASQSAIAFYGYPQAQLIGMPISQINTQAAERVAEERLQALQEKRNFFNFQHRLASGAVRDVEVYSTPVEVDDRTVLFSIIHDVSERKALQETLKESELRYRTVADFTVDWEYWVLPDGTLRYVSPSSQLLCGYSAEQLYADPTLVTRMVHPDDRHLFAGHTHHLSDSGVPQPIDFRIVTQGGETIWISHVCRPVFDPAGQPLGLRASNRDITERKAVETALARSNADLQRFSEITAHHLQEPARRMASYAERLARQLAGRLDDAEALLSLDFIGQQARRQQNLLRDIERYLAANQPRGAVESINVQQCVSALLVRWQDRIRQTSVDITLGELPSAWIDRPRLNDLFEVALDNALIHGRGARPLHILIEGKCDGRKACYTISDNGPGVEPQYRERVFRVFERLAPAGDSASTGIGLAILRRIAESCGGAARLEESDSGGVRLVFELATEQLT